MTDVVEVDHHELEDDHNAFSDLSSPPLRFKVPMFRMLSMTVRIQANNLISRMWTK